MFRSAIFAVLAIALSSSPALARQADSDEQNALVIDGVMLDSVRRAMTASTAELSPAFGQQVSAIASTSLLISAEATQLASFQSGFVGAATPVAPAASDLSARQTPWWATTLAVAGPIADGLSTVYAIRQSGPNARVIEGNGLYYKMFGSDVKPGEIMAFKVAQAALMGTVVHFGGRHSREMAIGTAILQSGINFFVASLNMRTAAKAKRLNTGQR